MRRRILRALVLVLITMFLVPLTADARKPVTPIIAAALAFVNQTGPIASVVLDAPVADTTYRVSIYSETQATPNVVGEICPQLSWTDDYASRTRTFGGAPITSTFPQWQNATQVFRVKGGTMLSFAVIGSDPGCAFPSSYGVFVVAEVIDAP